MRDDLLEARAAVDWAVAQLPTLEARIGSWRKNSPHIISQNFDPRRGKDAIKIGLKPLPPLVNAEAGAIINSIRSSLDLLVTALAERNGHSTPNDTYFPVYKSFSRFNDPGDSTHEKIRCLSQIDAAAIKSLHPYPGGDDRIVALDDLDMMRRHRRLVETPSEIARWNISGFGLDAEFPNTWIRLEDDSPHVWVRAGAHNYKLDVAIEVTFHDPPIRASNLLTPVLREFANLAYSIIQIFER
jgi:hypothetical protein